MRFYLKQKISPSRPDIYYVCWTDDDGRGHRRSTRTADFSEAQLVKGRLILEHDKPRDLRPETTTLKWVLLNYWEKHGKTRNTTLPIKYATKDVCRHLGDCTVAEFDDEKQKKYIATLQRIGEPKDWLQKHEFPAQSGPTVARRLTVLIAALNFAVAQKALSATIPIRQPEKTERAGVRRFTMEEMRSVFKEARSETERIALLIWTTTLCRPGQLLDLTWDRVDFEEHSINFKVPGMRLTNKRRAKVLMCPTVYEYLKARRSAGYVLENSKNGEPLKGFKHIMKAIVQRAALKGSAYRIRKAASSYLTNAGVATIQVQAMLAHKFADSETWRYNEADLPPVIKHLEALLREIDAPWLPLVGLKGVASDLRVASANLLFSQVAANDAV